MEREEGHNPEFEHPDIEHLRGAFHGPTAGEEVAGWFRTLFQSKTVRTILLALLILIVLAAAGLYLIN